MLRTLSLVALLAAGADSRRVRRSSSQVRTDKRTNETSLQARCFSQMPYASFGKAHPTGSPQSKLIVYIYNKGFRKADRSKKNVDLCNTMFPFGKPMVWPGQSSKESKQVCVLAQTKYGLQPIFWSDYNEKRGVPNFVARFNPGRPSLGSPTRKWVTLCGSNTRCGLHDKPYKPGSVTPTRGSHCSKSPDAACKERVSSRGHLTTLANMAWDANAAKATNTYANTAPARQPFDGAQWNQREKRVQLYSEREGPIFVVSGTSSESDGVLAKEGIEVPSMFWSAVYDPRKNAAVAWTCRNGMKSKDECNCADGLSKEAMEKAAGVQLWPGVSNVKFLSGF